MLLSLTEPEKLDLTAQKAALMSFLGEYVSHISAEQVAAFCRVRTTAAQIASLLPGRTPSGPHDGAAEDTALSRGRSRAGAVFCTTLTQALLPEEKSFISAAFPCYSRDTAGKETACFLDEERERFQGTNPTLCERRCARSESAVTAFGSFFANHEGEIVLSYSDFDITRKSELSPAPAFRTAAKHLGFCRKKDAAWCPMCF